MLTTPRLSLRPHSPDDLRAMQDLYGDEAINRYIRGLPVSEEDTWNRLLRYVGHWATFGFGIFAVRTISDDRIIGEVGFADFHRGLGSAFDPHPEAAWLFRGSAHGQGYAMEAMVAASEWLAGSLKFERTVCIIDVGNHGSLRLAQKLGYESFAQGDYRDAKVEMLARTHPEVPAASL